MIRSAVAVLVLAVVPLCTVAPAVGQVHELDPVPWSALADSTSRAGVVMSWDLKLGGEHRWRSQRLGLALRLPVGAAGMFFLRGHHVRMETGNGGALERWPTLRADDLSDDAAAGWPGEDLIEDFGQPEAGLLIPLSVPWLGPGDGAVTVRLPFGKEELYPIESRALMLRVEWRRRAIAVGPLELSGWLGRESAFDASGEVFVPEAFPGGWRHGVDLGLPPSRRWGLSLGWQARELANDRHLRRALAEAWVEIPGHHRLRLTTVRELGATTHRFADWHLGIGLELRPPAVIEED